eukprot:6491474-Amphidinium_carterae.6
MFGQGPTKPTVTRYRPLLPTPFTSTLITFNLSTSTSIHVHFNLRTVLIGHTTLSVDLTSISLVHPHTVITQLNNSKL